MCVTATREVPLVSQQCEKPGHKDLILLSGNYLGGVEPNKASCLSGLSQFRCGSSSGNHKALTSSDMQGKSDRRDSLRCHFEGEKSRQNMAESAEEAARSLFPSRLHTK